MDVKVFGTVKPKWAKLVKNHYDDKKCAISQKEFSGVLEKLFHSLTTAPAISGFAEIGIVPFCRHAIPKSKLGAYHIHPMDAVHVEAIGAELIEETANATDTTPMKRFLVDKFVEKSVQCANVRDQSFQCLYLTL